jgi:hypothetical protein
MAASAAALRAASATSLTLGLSGDRTGSNFVPIAVVTLRSMVRAHREQENDWQRDTQHPKQNSAAHDSVSFRNVSARDFAR